MGRQVRVGSGHGNETQLVAHDEIRVHVGHKLAVLHGVSPLVSCWGYGGAAVNGVGNSTPSLVRVDVKR